MLKSLWRVTPHGLALSICAGLCLPVASLHARELVGETVEVVRGQPESWIVSQGSSLAIGQDASALNVQLRNGSRLDLYGSIDGHERIGIQVVNDAGMPGGGRKSYVTLFDGSDVSGAMAGAVLGAGADFTARGSRVSSSEGFGIVLTHADVLLADDSFVVGRQSGMRIFRDDRGETVLPTTRTLTIDGSHVEGLDGSGILIDTLSARSQPTDASITLTNGSSVSGGNGVAFELAERTAATIDVSDSDIRGSVRVADGSSATLALRDGSTLIGGIAGNVTARVASGSIWRLTESSTLNELALDGGQVEFQEDDGYHDLNVRGDFTGMGGQLFVHTRLDAVGPLSAQATDRVLIEGDVTTTGTTLVSVSPTGAGVPTDANGNGRVDADEGISLVQVAGHSRADAFSLAGGYVAMGGFRYGLHAFGPGEVDPSQNALGSGSLQWDYRLGAESCTERGCVPVDPVKPGPPVPERDAVVPQLPSYLSAPTALLTYGDVLNDGLRQRMGDLRHGGSTAPLGGEVFARYLGGQWTYESNRSFRSYGYDFDQQVNALQIGGGLISLDGDNGTLRAGWAVDRGTTRVSPRAVDGASATKYRAMGGTAWVTWQSGNGWWVDGLVAGERYRGEVSTDSRGSSVARLRASGRMMSVEVGKSFDLGGSWFIEPRLQVKYQTLRFGAFSDADGLDVELGTARQGSARIGALVSRFVDPRLMPYARLDLIHTASGDPSVSVRSRAWGVSDRFGTGRLGDAVRVAAGATSQVARHVQLYGEGTYQRFVGGYGLRGWSGNLGVRVTF